MDDEGLDGLEDGLEDALEDVEDVEDVEDTEDAEDSVDHRVVVDDEDRCVVTIVNVVGD